MIHIPKTIKESFDSIKVCKSDTVIITKTTPPLIHQSARFLFVLNGKGTISIDDHYYKIQKNSFISILPWQIAHVTEVIQPLEMLKIVYNYEVINSSMRFSYNINSKKIPLLKLFSTFNVLKCNQEDSQKIISTITQLTSDLSLEENIDSPDQKGFQQLKIVNQLISLIIVFKSVADTQSIEQKPLNLKSSIFSYIYANSNKKITLSILADTFLTSPKNISNYINKNTGTSLSRLINEIKIAKALNILVYTNLSLSEIAEVIGYTDAPHLLRVFKKSTGLTTQEYLNLYYKDNSFLSEKEKTIAFDLINYIYHNYKEELNKTELINKFRISEVQLNMILLYHVELNFKEFINVLRVNKACEMLLSTDLPIVEISTEVGYNTTKTFNRNFLKYKKMLPSDFRKQVLFR